MVVVGAWLPFFLFWVLFVMSFAQGTLSAALTSGLVSIGGAAVLGVAVWRFCRSRPWPVRVQPSFYAKHLAAASALRRDVAHGAELECSRSSTGSRFSRC